MLHLLMRDYAHEAVAAVERLFGRNQALRLNLTAAYSLENAMRAARAERPDCVLLGTALLALEQEELLAEQIGAFRPVPVIVLAEPEHAKCASRVLRAGAADWVPKESPVFLSLPRIVAHVLERRELRRALETAEERCRQAEQRMQALLESAPIPVVLMDGEGAIRRVGEPAVRLLGRTADRLSGRRLMDFAAPESRPEIGRMLDELRQEGELERRGRVGLEESAGGLGRSVELRVRAVEAEGREQFVAWLVEEVEIAGAHADLGRLETLVREVSGHSPDGFPGAVVCPLALAPARTASPQGWREMERRVRAVVERLLRCELAPDERFLATPEGFLLLFPRRPEAELRSRLAAVEEAVEAALLGIVPGAPPATDGMRPGRADSSPQTADQGEGVAAEHRRTEIWEALTQRLRSGRDAVPSKRDGVVAELLRRHVEARYEAVYGQDGSPGHLALLVLEDRTRDLLARLKELGAREPEAHLDHDIFILAQHRLALEAEEDRDQLLAVVDLSLHTFHHRQLQQRYLECLRELPDLLRRHIVINLTEVEAGAYAPKLAQQLALVRDLCAMTAIQLAEPTLEPPDLGVLRVPLLVVDLRTARGDPTALCDHLGALARKARHHRTQLLVRGVPRGLGPRLRADYGVDFTTPR